MQRRWLIGAQPRVPRGRLGDRCPRLAETRSVPRAQIRTQSPWPPLRRPLSLLQHHRQRLQLKLKPKLLRSPLISITRCFPRRSELASGGRKRKLNVQRKESEPD